MEARLLLKISRALVVENTLFSKLAMIVTDNSLKFQNGLCSTNTLIITINTDCTIIINATYV